VARLVPATGPHELKGSLVGIAMTAGEDEDLFAIYATAIEQGLRLVTKDRRLRSHRHPRPLALW
jgi:hypothetical protein